MRLRKLYAVEVLQQDGWEVKAVSTSKDMARLAWENVTKGRRARLNEYTYDDLDFLWTQARGYVTLDKVTID